LAVDERQEIELEKEKWMCGLCGEPVDPPDDLCDDCYDRWAEVYGEPPRITDTLATSETRSPEFQKGK